MAEHGIVEEQAGSVASPSPVPGPLPTRVLGEAGLASAQARTHDCERPIRLRGAKELVNKKTGEVHVLYASDRELDGSHGCRAETGGLANASRAVPSTRATHGSC